MNKFPLVQLIQVDQKYERNVQGKRIYNCIATDAISQGLVIIVGLSYKIIKLNLKPIIAIQEWNYVEGQNIVQINKFKVKSLTEKMIGNPVPNKILVILYQIFKNLDDNNHDLLYYYLKQEKEQKKQEKIQKEKNSASQNRVYHPIISLDDKCDRVYIKARILYKSQLKQSSKENWNGQYFTIQIVDSDGDQIKGVFFNNMCDKYYDLLEFDVTYEFYNFQVKLNTFEDKNCEFQYGLIFKGRCTINQLDDDVPIYWSNIQDINRQVIGSIVNLFGYIAVECQNENGIGQKFYERRQLAIRDNTGTILLNIWPPTLDNVQTFGNIFIAIYNVRISKLKYLQLNTIGETKFETKLDKLSQIKNFQSLYINQEKLILENNTNQKSDLITVFAQQHQKFDLDIFDQNSKILYEEMVKMENIQDTQNQYKQCEISKKKLKLNKITIKHQYIYILQIQSRDKQLV